MPKSGIISLEIIHGTVQFLYPVGSFFMLPKIVLSSDWYSSFLSSLKNILFTNDVLEFYTVLKILVFIFFLYSIILFKSNASVSVIFCPPFRVKRPVKHQTRPLH